MPKSNVSLGDIALLLTKSIKAMQGIEVTLSNIQNILDDGLNRNDSYGRQGADAVSHALHRIADNIASASRDHR